MAGNVVVTTTRNDVVFSVDNKSFNDAKKKINSLKSEWEKTTSAPRSTRERAARPKGGERFDAAAKAKAAKDRKEATAAAKEKAAAAKAEALAQRQQNRELAKQQRVIDKMNARQARFAPVYNNTKGAMNYTQRAQARADFAKINQDYAKGAIGAQTYTARLAELQKQMRATAKQSRQVMPSQFVGGGLSPVASAIGAGLGAYGVLGAGKSLMNTGVSFQGIHSILKMTEDDAAGAAQSMEYLMGLSSRLGVDMVDLADQYAKMNLSRGKLSKQTVQDVVTGMQEYGTALHIDKNRMSLANFGLQQVFGKGRLQAQELNQQIAESLPGAKQAFLKAWQDATGNANLTQGMFDEDMAKGLITTDKIMPHLGKAFADMARKGDALNFAVKGINASYNRMINNWNLLKNKIFESRFGDALTNSFEKASAALENLSDVAGGRLGDVLGGLIDGFVDMATYVHDGFVLADRVIEHYLTKWGLDADQISKAFNFVGWTAGALLFGSGLLRITNLLKNLIKLVPGIKSLGKALAGAGLASEAVAAAVGTAGAAAKGAPTSTGGVVSKAVKGAGVIAGGQTAATGGASKLMKFLGPVGELLTAYEVAKSQFGDQTENITAAREEGKRPMSFIDNAAQQAGMWQLSESMYPTPALVNDLKPDVPYTGHIDYMKQTASPTMDTFKSPTVNVQLEQPKEVDVKVDLNVKDGKITDLIEASIQDQQAMTFNLLAGGGQ
ncbi:MULTISPECIES: tape measure protein [Serratia]|uniref:tape measure protein n=1 Tax=Serratia TaxID=613 RepID=UPI000B9753FA|nr:MULTISPECIES: tape measure protein [Serratia]MBX9281093.1 tape measure protein [Serratia marcescens]MBX9288113.1 tape measure protein [Serratia marcescens]MBX9291199.1 tape measure protein [Serratia marcescens]MBX9300372.1 tape measure protein [Serratia marcescens]MBX9322284.1 tape measure protein [Serratia marcescens]